ncbi:glutamate ABC transporter substrate-binding protein [Streptomyces sp. MJP52]|uniref:glutamate ABC transporter substrate-binding protein n=1 Tax=Streptomyces sp. MJP52 TaxID=2940555 RepID=UPI0024745541|nr:glutamate ABC transporter substrate-binding protein [Streptomyces sp. MJP52]MDH6226934.1 polar amino acid transport system substrate-binding protein [Streptomyces sp. MJP52]
MRRRRGDRGRGRRVAGVLAGLCALAAGGALLLPQERQDAGRDADAGPTGTRSTAANGRHAADDTDDACERPEARSPAPSEDEGGETVQEIKERGHLRVGVDQNSYGWGYRDPNGGSRQVELSGFDIDLAKRIADEILGPRGPGQEPNIRFHAIPTNQRVPAVREGRVDMVVRTMTISCERLEEVSFSAPYFTTGQQVLAPARSDVRGYDRSLAGKKICTAASSTAHLRLRKDKEEGAAAVAGADIGTTVPNQLDCLVRLQLGEVDAVVTDSALAASQAAQDPSVALKGEEFTEEYYGVAMAKEADDLVRRVNAVLRDYVSDGGWKRAYDRWLEPTMKKPADPPPAVYRD